MMKTDLNRSSLNVYGLNVHSLERGRSILDGGDDGTALYAEDGTAVFAEDGTGVFGESSDN